MPRLNPNTFIGLNTKFGWVAIPKSIYRDNITIPQLEAAVTPTTNIHKVITNYISQTEPITTTKPKRNKKDSLEPQTHSTTKKEAKQKYYRHIIDHNSVPPDFDFGTINLTHAWAHFLAKHHDPSLSISEMRQQLSQKWNQLSAKEKSRYKEDYIEQLKGGLVYEKGKLVPLAKKYRGRV